MINMSELVGILMGVAISFLFFGYKLAFIVSFGYLNWSRTDTVILIIIALMVYGTYKHLGANQSV